MTNETKHTPGPWEYSTLGKQAAVTAKNKNGYESMHCSVHSFNQDENEANARLIAAAPDMLEALEELIFQMDEKPDSIHYAPAERAKRLEEFLPKARAAIAKARGWK